MSQQERDYLLRIINLQDSALQAHAQKNMSKFLTLMKELERTQKATFSEVMANIKEQKKELVKKIDEKMTDIQNLVKELKSL